MPGSCCTKPVARIIKVGEFEAGLVGLDQALRNVYISGVADQEEIKRDLLQWIRDFGNYIPPPRENDYKEALLTEYRKFCAAVERESKVEGQAETSMPAKEQKKRQFKLF
jgi:hypothetical protein